MMTKEQICLTFLHRKHLNELTLQGKPSKAIERCAHPLGKASDHFDCCHCLATIRVTTGQLSFNRLNLVCSPAITLLNLTLFLQFSMTA